MKYLTFSLLGLTLTSCIGSGFFEERGNGNIVTEDREVSDYSTLVLRGNYEVIITEGNAPSLDIETDENLMEYIVTKMDGDRLVIENKERIFSDDGIRINITYTELDQIEASGAISLENYGTLSGDELELSLSGAGEIDLKVDVDRLDVHSSGAGSVDLAGEADIAGLHVSGAGGVDAYNLTTSVCDVSVSGVGGAEVFVTEELKARVSGVGGISYKGDPAVVDTNVSGIGTIESRD